MAPARDRRVTDAPLFDQEPDAAKRRERYEFLGLVDKRAELSKRLREERKQYVEMGCDKFDWLKKGNTREQREARHREEIDKVRRQIRNYYKIKLDFK